MKGRYQSGHIMSFSWIYLVFLLHLGIFHQAYLGVFGGMVSLEFLQVESVTKCEKGVETGDKIVFLAAINTTAVDKSDWPLDNIRLGYYKDSKYGVLCQVNVERDGCHGFQPAKCGYCNDTDGEIYHVVFNVTALDEIIYFDCLWIGKENRTASNIIRVDVKSDSLKLYSSQKHIFRFSPNLPESSTYFAEVCKYATPFEGVYLNYSLSDTQHSSKMDGGCVQFDENLLLTHQDEEIVFRYQSPCNREIEIQCLARELLLPNVFCVDPLFKNSTVGGRDLTRITWECLSDMASGMSCAIKQDGNLNKDLKRARARRGNLIQSRLYQYLCQLEVLSKDIYNGNHWNLESLPLDARERNLCSGDQDPFLQYIPTPKLSSTCPDGKWVKDGYIRKGTTATCICEISDQDYPLGKVQWFDPQGVKLNLTDTVAILTIISDSNDMDDENQTYTCRGVSESGGHNQGVEFIPRFLKGPVVSNFTVNGSTALVVQEGQNVTFFCQVENVASAIAVLVGPGLGQIEEYRSQNETLEFHLSNLTCEDSGKYACRAECNLEFKATQNSQLFVDIMVKCPTGLTKGPLSPSASPSEESSYWMGFGVLSTVCLVIMIIAVAICYWKRRFSKNVCRFRKTGQKNKTASPHLDRPLPEIPLEQDEEQPYTEVIDTPNVDYIDPIEAPYTCRKDLLHAYSSLNEAQNPFPGYVNDENIQKYCPLKSIDDTDINV